MEAKVAADEFSATVSVPGIMPLAGETLSQGSVAVTVISTGELPLLVIITFWVGRGVVPPCQLMFRLLGLAVSASGPGSPDGMSPPLASTQLQPKVLPALFPVKQVP